MHVGITNKWDSQPRILTDEEIANPMQVIHEVFDYAHLPDLRNTLWEWLKTTITGNYNKSTLHYKDRESLLALYEKLQKLLEAAHLLLVASQLQATPKKLVPELSTAPPAAPPSDPEMVPATELVPLVDRLVSLLSPELLFEAGKIQESDVSLPVYHFLLVLPNTATGSFTTYQQAAQNAGPETGTIQLMTIKHNELERHLAEGHLLYATLCREERLVYAKDNQEIPPVNPAALASRLAQGRDGLEAILTKAASFYQGATLFLQLPDEALAVFHLQQAMEHSLRGFLYAITGRTHYSHDLLFLRLQCLPLFPQLVNLLPIEHNPSLCLLQQASNAYTKARYSNHFTMPVTEIKQLKDWVEKLLPATRVAFKRWIAPLVAKVPADSL